MLECIIKLEHYPSGDGAALVFVTNDPDKAMDRLRLSLHKPMAGFLGGITRGMLMTPGESEFESDSGVVVKARTQVVCMN